MQVLRFSKLLAILVMQMSVGGCNPILSPNAFADGSPEMWPEMFFAGTTTSTGALESSSGAPTDRLHVEGQGQMLGNGSFRLDQRVTLGQEQPRLRTWVLQRIDEHRYTGTLTDASGPVEGEAYGDLFYVTYAMKRPFGGRMEQWLYLQPDGHTVVNEATIRLFGFVVAHISERITRADP